MANASSYPLRVVFAIESHVGLYHPNTILGAWTVSDKHFSWIPAYEAIADALLERKNRRDEVLEVFKEVSGVEDRNSVDPFTFFTAFNRGMISYDRKSAIETVMHRFGVDAPLPEDFLGIPSANHELWQYFDTSSQGVEDCWNLFDVALELTRQGHGKLEAETLDVFYELFDKVHQQENITKARLTRTLYWMRPRFYLPFGEKTREYVHAQYGIDTPIVMRGKQYMRLVREMLAVCEEPFYVVAARAYKAADEESWWPELRDYDPDMSIHQWMVLLEDKTLTDEHVLKTLRRIRDAGGDATPDELADERRHDREYYSNMLRNYSRETARKMGRSDFKGSWWPFLFVGRNADESRKGDYIWRLRPEVIDALDALDEQEL